MKERCFEFRTQEELNIIEWALYHEGYEVVGGKKASLKEIQEHFKRNKVFVVVAFYNSLNKKYEYQYSTRQIIKNNGGK